MSKAHKSKSAIPDLPDTNDLLQAARRVVEEARRTRKDFVWANTIHTRLQKRMLKAVHDRLVVPAERKHDAISKDPLLGAVARLLAMYSDLQCALLEGKTGGSLQDLAKEASILALALEVLIGRDREPEAEPPNAAETGDEPSWVM